MDSFDFFGEVLFDEAKYLFEKATETKHNREQQLFLHSSLLMAISALEAYINSVCEELVDTPVFCQDFFLKIGRKIPQFRMGNSSES